MVFLSGLIVALLGGMGLGYSLSSDATSSILRLLQPSWLTAVVLFLMAFTLDSRQRGLALRYPLSSILACLINLGGVPLLAMVLLPFQERTDFSIGLWVVAATPCTLATASVFTRAAGGNDAVSLITTLLTNVGCVIVTPLWLGFSQSDEEGSVLGPLMQTLLVSVLLPTLAGQFTQEWPRLREWMLRHRQRLSSTAQVLVLIVVATAAMSAGRSLAAEPAAPTVRAVTIMIVSCVILHLTAVGVGWWSGRILGIGRREIIAMAIAGSQKTLPVGLIVASHPDLLTLGGEESLPYLTFPLVAYHAAQLLIDGWLATWWKRTSAA